MTRDRLIASRSGIDRSSSRRPTEPAKPARNPDDDFSDALWLYEWSYAALRPTGEAFVLRVADAD
jgi:hypothetical protein